MEGRNDHHTGSVLSQRPDSFGRFGRFGGKYVPETLIHALTQLEAAFHSLASDEDFQVLFVSLSFFSFSTVFCEENENGYLQGLKKFLNFAERA